LAWWSGWHLKEFFQPVIQASHGPPIPARQHFNRKALPALVLLKPALPPIPEDTFFKPVGGVAATVGLIVGKARA